MAASLMNSGKRLSAASSVRQNVIANFLGKIWTSLVSLLFVPIYLKYLGIEAYGLIGIYLSIMAVLSFLDMGLGTTLSRELARLSASPGNEQESRELVRAMETVYWCVGILIGVTMVLLAPFIARHWVNPKGLTAGTVEKAVMIMGFLIAFDWPAALYSGGLMGLQKQPLLNAIRAGMGTIQAVGAVLVLWLVSPTIVAYFLWQVVVSLAQAAALALSLWRSFPGTGRMTPFRKKLLAKNLHFTAGVAGISVLSMLLTQTDKIILSKLLSLEAFGYYVLAYNVANMLNHIANPLFMALFPRFSQLLMERDESNMSVLYHAGSQLLSLVILPLAVTVGFFAPEILTLWTRDPVLSEHTHLLLRLFLVGTTLTSILVTPYAAQLAAGWTSLSVIKNIVGVCLFVPSILLLTPRYGGVAVGVAWIALYLGYFLVEIPIMHRRILRGEMSRWYVKDTVLPMALVLAVGLLSRMVMPEAMSFTRMLLWLAGTVCAAAAVSSLPMSNIRLIVREIAEGATGVRS